MTEIADYKEAVSPSHTSFDLIYINLSHLIIEEYIVHSQGAYFLCLEPCTYCDIPLIQKVLASNRLKDFIAAGLHL